MDLKLKEFNLIQRRDTKSLDLFLSLSLVAEVIKCAANLNVSIHSEPIQETSVEVEWCQVVLI